MASSKSKEFVLFLFVSTFAFVSVTCKQYEVGGENGWKTPKSKDEQETFNEWASQNRFIVGDTILFKYEKDSVVEVSEEEYEKCHSPHPLFFSNNGNTAFDLDRSGSFYFISGISGHCEKGQKIIIKVLKHHHQAHVPTPSPSPSYHTSQATTISAKAMFRLSSPSLVLFVMSFVGLVFFA